MTTAYILIVAKTGMEQKVTEELALFDFVGKADMVYGEYDIIVKLQSEDITRLTESVLSKIRPIQGISRTSTLIVAKE